MEHFEAVSFKRVWVKYLKEPWEIPLKIYCLSSLLEGFVEEAPPKDLVIVFFVECFKTTTLKKSDWEILTVFSAILLDITFP